MSQLHGQLRIPAPLLEAMEGLEGPVVSSLGSAEGSCFAGYLWGFTWDLCSDKRDQPTAAQTISLGVQMALCGITFR